MHDESFLGSWLREEWKSKTKEDKEVRALTLLANGEISECDSECGSAEESEKWSSALVNNDMYVHPSFVVEVVGVGERSDSGWEFGSECGSVDVSGVLVVHDAGEAVLSVVTVRCDGVPPESEWDLVETQSFSSPRSVISLLWKSRRTRFTKERW